MTPPGGSDGASRKAYTVIEAMKGEMEWLVYADSVEDARAQFYAGERGEAIQNQVHPAGVRSVRRCPSEDRDDA